MPLIQGGPPEWIWERTANLLRWEVVPSQAPDGHPPFELRVQCGLEIMRIQFLTDDEIKELRAVIDKWASGAREDERDRPEREPGVSPEREPGAVPEVPDAERPPRREEGIVTDPDAVARHRQA